MLQRGPSATRCHDEEVINSLRHRGLTEDVRGYGQSDGTVRHSPAETRSAVSEGHVELYTV